MEREGGMTEGGLEPLLLEMQTLSQKYALGKMARRKFETQLKDLQEHMGSEVINRRIHQEKKSAFYQGFVAASVCLALVYLFIKMLPWILIARF
jgi:hypothetical protein